MALEVVLAIMAPTVKPPLKCRPLHAICITWSQFTAVDTSVPQLPCLQRSREPNMQQAIQIVCGCTNSIGGAKKVLPDRVQEIQQRACGLLTLLKDPIARGPQVRFDTRIRAMACVEQYAQIRHQSLQCCRHKNNSKYPTLVCASVHTATVRVQALSVACPACIP